MRKFVAHLAKEAPAMFTFLADERVDATNWRAEQAIRPAVVDRKVCGANRTKRGALAQGTMMSIIRTPPSVVSTPSATSRDAPAAPTLGSPSCSPKALAPSHKTPGLLQQFAVVQPRPECANQIPLNYCPCLHLRPR